MTQTPAKKAASSDKQKRAENRLPTLPKGWTYATIIAVGPGGAQITVDASREVSGSYGVTVLDDRSEKRHNVVGSLPEATKAIQTGAKALAKIAEAEAAAKAAREESLRVLGDADPGTPETGETGGDSVSMTTEPSAPRPDDSTHL